MVKKSFMRDYPIRVIQNGIDVNTFYPRKEAAWAIRERYGLHNRFVILGVASGWSEDVGMSTFFNLRD